MQNPRKSSLIKNRDFLGVKLYKRQAIKKRDQDRDTQRNLK